jgi:hypothetical protein
MKIKVFDPVYTQYQFIQDLFSQDINFEVLFSLEQTLIPQYLIEFLITNDVKYSFIDEDKIAVEKDDLLISCTDLSVSIVDKLNRQSNNIYADADICSIYKNDRSRYLESFTMDNVCYPCVAKLKKSFGGGKSTHIVHNYEELSSLNLDWNDYFLQPWYNGIEYAVDFISVNGKHYLTGVWQYYKKEKFTVVLSKVKIVHDDNLKTKIYNKMSKVLTDIGKLNGATHSEIFLDNDEIKIGEINFRFHGHVTNKYYSLATGLSQTYAFLNVFVKKNSIPEIYLNNETVYRICCNLEKCIPETKIDYNKIENLPSIIHIFKHPSFNDDPTTYGPTTDMFNTLCFVLMQETKDYFADLKVIEKWVGELNE